MPLGSRLSPNFLLLLPSFLPLLLSHLYCSKLSPLIRRGRESRKAKTCWMLGDCAPRLKKSPNGLRSSKRLYKRGKEARKGERVRHLSLRLGFQLPCSMVSPWGIMHPSGISMGVMDAMWPQLWRRLYYSLMIWPSCGPLRGMRFSLTSKDIWAWCAPFFFFTSLWLFVRLPTPLLSGCPSCFQGWGDHQFRLPLIGWWKE